MKMRVFPLSKVYSLIEPGPVIMVTTSRAGKNNVMTMAWHTMLDFVPPLIGIVMGEEDYSFGTLKATKECVIAIPTVDIARTVVKVGSTSGEKTDKFAKFGLTPMKASVVKAPLIAECYANIECRVIDTALVKQYNFFVVKGVKAWIDPGKRNPQTIHHRGNGVFAVDGKIIKLPFRL